MLSKEKPCIEYKACLENTDSFFRVRVPRPFWQFGSDCWPDGATQALRQWEVFESQKIVIVGEVAQSMINPQSENLTAQICCKPRTDHFFKKWLACGLQENDSTQGKWSHNDASHKALHIKAAQGKSIKAAVSTSHNKTKKGLPFHPKYAAFVLPFPTNLRITLDWQWDPKSLWSSLPSTILIPCPFVIGHTNTGSWIVEENSSTIQFPQCCHQHWSQLVTEVLFNQLSVQCPKHVRYVHNVVEMYHAVSGLQKRWSSILEDHSFWRWFWFDRRQGERLWSVTTDQAPFFFKLRRAKIGFDAFQRKALYWIQGLSWKHWFLFQSQSPTTILTIWLRLLARWCDTGPRIMNFFWISKNCHHWWACVAQSMINPQSENLTAQIDLQMQTTRQKVHGCG